MAEQRRIYGASTRSTRIFWPRSRGMPDASGAALGFDRLVMLATGADSVEAVQWTPVFEPGASA